jgi:CRP-like cAMP-binding protein
LDNQSVTRARHESGPFSDFLISYLSSENVRLKEHLLDHLFNSSEKRLVRVLLLLANYGEGPHEHGIIANIDQQTLAKMVGTTRARINFFMNKFRRKGLIEYNGDIHIQRSLLDVLLHD